VGWDLSIRTSRRGALGTQIAQYHAAGHVQVNTVTSAMTYMSVGYDNSWNHDKWAQDFAVKVIQNTHEMAEFELINVDPSIVNSLRRILLAEVPCVAIENVFVIDYDCVIPEEVLSHRLGLVPLAVDAEQLADKTDKADQSNTIVFKLDVTCRKVSSLPTIYTKLKSANEISSQCNKHFDGHPGPNRDYVHAATRRGHRK
jgi:hypothetical protein